MGLPQVKLGKIHIRLGLSYDNLVKVHVRQNWLGPS